MSKIYADEKMELKEKLKAAFKELRGNGFLARCNFSCCQTCGSYDLSEKAKEIAEKKNIRKRGYAFWHKQDEDRLWEHGSVHIAFSTFTKEDEGFNSDLSDADVAKEIILALVKQGIRCEWNGDINCRIEAFAK
jgi:hypothetical protein